MTGIGTIRNDLRVSIVMTVYNHEEFVGEAIESVLSQSFENYEFIIINDGSTDNTARVLEAYEGEKKITIKNIEHVGRARALNIGFNNAEGEYISIIDSDDLYLADKIKKQVDYLDRHSEIVMVGSNAIEYDLINNTKYRNVPPTEWKSFKKLLLFEAVLPFPTIMIRKHILKEVQFCNESLELKVDFDLIGKVAAKGKVGIIPEELVIIRRHPKNNFRFYHPEKHRRALLRVRWLNLWRLKPHFLLFSRMLLWLSFEYFINLIPEKERHMVPNYFRTFFKNTKAVNPTHRFSSIKKIQYF